MVSRLKPDDALARVELDHASTCYQQQRNRIKLGERISEPMRLSVSPGFSGEILGSEMRSSLLRDIHTEGNLAGVHPFTQ